MGAYKLYREERIIYNDLEKIKLNQNQVKIVVKKIQRHFKINYLFVNKKPKILLQYRTIKVKFNRRNWNIVYTESSVIEFQKNPSLRTVAHECAHILANRRYNKRCYHNKLYKKEMKRICNYIRKKNYWNYNLENIS